MKVRFILPVLLLVTSQANAFKCYITAVKDSCWNDFNVTIKIIDYATNKLVVDDLVIPKGKSWARNSFECTPKEAMIYKANYSPAIWKGQEQKVYTSKRIWYLPKKVGKEEVAWNIPICYGRDFSQVPLPPKVSGNCKCDFDAVPAIPGQEKAKK